MYFRLVDETQIPNYERTLGLLAKFVEDAVRLIMDACVIVQKETFPEEKLHHSPIILLMRHVIETLDGVGILVGKGSVENCGPLLRSAFEANVGILYMLDKDTELRALAYQVAHVHKKIKIYRRFIASDAVGKAVRDELKNEPLVAIFDQPEIDWQLRINNIARMLTRPEYAPIQAEWERTKKARGKKDPPWYALFDGPHDVRAMCKRLEMRVQYDTFYRFWVRALSSSSPKRRLTP